MWTLFWGRLFAPQLNLTSNRGPILEPPPSPFWPPPCSCSLGFHRRLASFGRRWWTHGVERQQRPTCFQGRCHARPAHLHTESTVAAMLKICSKGLGTVASGTTTSVCTRCSKCPARPPEGENQICGVILSMRPMHTTILSKPFLLLANLSVGPDLRSSGKLLVAFRGHAFSAQKTALVFDAQWEEHCVAIQMRFASNGHP